MRAYIRHPIDIPLNVDIRKPPVKIHSLKDVSEGGLCFYTDHALPSGTLIHISIPIDDNRYEEDCIVMWSKQVEKGFLTGVRFKDSASAFRARMMEQVCYIEQYRKEQLKQGRPLQWAEAAREWIEKFGASFPDFNTDKNT